MFKFVDSVKLNVWLAVCRSDLCFAFAFWSKGWWPHVFETRHVLGVCNIGDHIYTLYAASAEPTLCARKKIAYCSGNSSKEQIQLETVFTTTVYSKHFCGSTMMQDLLSRVCLTFSNEARTLSRWDGSDSEDDGGRTIFIEVYTFAVERMVSPYSRILVECFPSP